MIINISDFDLARQRLYQYNVPETVLNYALTIAIQGCLRDYFWIDT